MPVNILNMVDYTVISVDYTDHDYHIKAETKSTPSNCPYCQSKNLVGFGRREQLVKDMPMHGRRVGLYVSTRRIKCQACHKTFSESLPEVDDKRAMTKRLLEWIGKQAIKRTFTSIAEEVGITEGTVRIIFNDYIGELEQTVKFETPTWMGIDEIYLIKPRGVITNIRNNTAVEILKDRNKKTVADYLYRLKDRDNVQYVAMDMWKPYRDAVGDVIPQAKVVVDKFHVVRMANDSMERVRKSMRADLTLKQKRGLMHDRFVLLRRQSELTDQESFNLDGWTKNYPLLGEAYRLKEAFFDIYDAKTQHDAMQRYETWRKSIPTELYGYFLPIVTAWSNWQPCIVEYFNHPITNAYTESLNNLIRVTNRLGRGYSFEALRAKILFSEGAHKVIQPRPKFERREESMSMNYAMFSLGDSLPSTRTVEKAKNYGADLSTLARMIEYGEI
ncbi:MAG: ISL3 family transposase [Methylococcaceae bacterium]|nr:ISL3 family transposase [Methylococcaceae bacterium]